MSLSVATGGRAFDSAVHVNVDPANKNSSDAIDTYSNLDRRNIFVEHPNETRSRGQILPQAKDL